MKYRVKLERCNCSTEDNYCNPLHCKVRLISRKLRYLDIACHLNHEFDYVLARFQLLYRVRLIYQPFLINVTEDVCAFMARNKSISIVDSMLSALFPAVAPNSNWIHPCPYNGNITTYAEITQLQHIIPSIIPVGQYKLVVELRNKKNVKPFTLDMYFLAYTEAKNKPNK